MSKTYIVAAFAVPLVLLPAVARGVEVAEIVWQSRVDRLLAQTVVVDHAGRAVVAGAQYLDDFSSFTRAIGYTATGATGFSLTFDGSPSGLDNVDDLAVDPLTGGVVLTGASANAPGDMVIQTIKLDAAGNVVWVRRGEAGDPTWGSDVEVDRLGNVYVVGSRYNGTNADMITICYAPDGTKRWVATFDAGGDESASSFQQGLQIDSAGNVYVAADFSLVAYDATGQERWVLDRQVTAIALDAAENLAVTAPTAGTELLTPAGARLWFNGYGSILMALADSGDVFLARMHEKGYSTSDWDTEVTRLRPDGTLAWTRRYDNGSQDSPAGLVVDAQNAVYVTGESWSRYGLFGLYQPDYLTIKYDGAGQQVWTARVKNVGTGATAIALGSDGRITVTGLAGTTVQYRQKQQTPAPCPWWLPWCW